MQRNKPTHIYLHDTLRDALFAYAKSEGLTMSKAVRKLLAPVLGADEIRQYIPDGQHTKTARDLQAVERILATMR